MVPKKGHKGPEGFYFISSAQHKEEPHDEIHTLDVPNIGEVQGNGLEGVE